MSGHREQRIVISPTRGTAREFVGDRYRIVNGPLGFRFVYDEAGTLVWPVPGEKPGGPVDITVTAG